MSFNWYLRKKLDESNTTQAELAAAIKVTKATINRWTKPFSKNPTENNMKKVIEYFNDDYKELLHLFLLEESWAPFFWKNFRCLAMEKKIDHHSIPNISEETIQRYLHSGSLPYVEYEDAKIIAEYCHCPIEKLLNDATTVDGGYNNVDIISSEPSFKDHWGLDETITSDFKVYSTEMHPLIQYGDQIVLKRDILKHFNNKIVSPKNGDIVVLKKKATDIFQIGHYYMIRRASIINGELLYVAENPAFAPIPASDQYTVVGIVAKSITEF